MDGGMGLQICFLASVGDVGNIMKCKLMSGFTRRMPSNGVDGCFYDNINHFSTE